MRAGIVRKNLEFGPHRAFLVGKLVYGRTLVTIHGAGQSCGVAQKTEATRPGRMQQETQQKRKGHTIYHDSTEEILVVMVWTPVLV